MYFKKSQRISETKVLQSAADAIVRRCLKGRRGLLRGGPSACQVQAQQFLAS